MNHREPSKLEMQVLSLLWQRGPLTARDILEALPDGKARAYTTVLSIMQVMEKKGLLSHTTQGNTHLYKATVSRDEVAGPVLRGLVRQVFGGPATALQHLLSEKEVSRGELDEIKRLIASHEETQKSTNENADHENNH